MWLALLALGLGGCLRTEPPDGALLCRDEAPRCPGGYECADDGTCWRNGHFPSTDLGGDNPNLDLGAPGEDLGAPDAMPGGPALSLLAGGLGGAGNADDIGARARFNGPRNVQADGAGNVIVSDTDNCVLRKVVIATGQASLFAGSPGVCGSFDGTSTAARFNGPRGLALDGAGNLLVADTANHTIRRVVLATGQVSTLAGAAKMPGSADGPAASARFNLPGELAVEAGVLFISDPANHTIRKLVLATGEVTTLAGTAGMFGLTDGIGPVARFSEPFGVATNGTGFVYVGDVGNDRIRRIEISSGDVTTVVTTPVISSVRRLATSGTNDVFYTGDTDYSVRLLSLGTGQVTSLAGKFDSRGTLDATGIAARFNGPAGMNVLLGNLFIADQRNHNIRQVELATQKVTTVAGAAPLPGSSDAVGSAARFNNPSAMVSDGAGNLFVSDTDNHTLRKLAVTSGEVTTVAGAGLLGQADGIGSAARFYNPRGLASDGAGNVFITDSTNRTIRKLVIATGAVTTIAGTVGVLGALDGAASAAQFNNPTALVFDGTSTLYIADTNNHSIRQLELSTMEVSTLAGVSGTPGSSDGVGAAARFRFPSGIEADHAGNLFVVDGGNHTVRQLVLSTKRVTTLAGSVGTPGQLDGIGPGALFNAPSNLMYDGAGKLYVADTDNYTIRTLTIATQAVSTWAGIAGRSGVGLGPLPARMNRPVGLARLGAGAIAILDQTENAVLVIR